MTTQAADKISEALRDTLISPNESDSNWENANVVDALCKISRGLYAVARAINMQTLVSREGLTPELLKKLRAATE